MRRSIVIKSLILFAVVFFFPVLCPAEEGKKNSDFLEIITDFTYRIGPGDSKEKSQALGLYGAKIALLGILPPNTAIDWDYVVFNGLTIKGIYGREMYETWYKMTVMLQSGLNIEPIITHRFHYTEYEKAFEVMRSGKSGKVILNWA